MAHVVVVTHEWDVFVPPGAYLLHDVLLRLEQHGHSWTVEAGPNPVPGDVAILHVDITVVDADYLALAGAYACTINFGSRDISKRHVSRSLLRPGDAWTGAVIVKPDLNFGGRAEATHNLRAVRAGRPRPHPGPDIGLEAVILPSITAVPDEAWHRPELVVERFLPEVDPQGFALRTWVFMGDQERCTRHVSPQPIVKSTNTISRRPVEVPAFLREERRRLGFDYGKFDFVVWNGQAVLLDANRTPGAPPHLRTFLQDGARQLAIGLNGLIAAAGLT